MRAENTSIKCKHIETFPEMLLETACCKIESNQRTMDRRKRVNIYTHVGDDKIEQQKRTKWDKIGPQKRAKKWHLNVLITCPILSFIEACLFYK